MVKAPKKSIHDHEGVCAMCPPIANNLNLKGSVFFIHPVFVPQSVPEKTDAIEFTYCLHMVRVNMTAN